ASRQFLQLRPRIEEEADAIREFASTSGSEFAIIKPRAPHFGGLWEAGVSLQSTYSYGRPQEAISEDPSDGEALTPGHLMVGGPLRALPAEGTPDQGLTCLNRWRAVSLFKQQFWRRWSKEYVLGLQVRSKWHRRLPNVVVELHQSDTH
ncbi:uncharacterized protein LOC135439592, partial [Drosophila montana]|uniref:uncharacterized protein LOC135439592 n=1 Tax=Drosophila montana TaxID=40370 RepID=UPI00313B09CE